MPVSDEGPFDQAAVAREEFDDLRLRHGAELIFQTHGAINFAAGIEKFFQFNAGGLVPAAQFRSAGWRFRDVDKFISDFFSRQQLFRLAAATAFFVAVKLEQRNLPANGPHPSRCAEKKPQKSVPHFDAAYKSEGGL